MRKIIRLSVVKQKKTAQRKTNARRSVINPTDRGFNKFLQMSKIKWQPGMYYFSGRIN